VSRKNVLTEGDANRLIAAQLRAAKAKLTYLAKAGYRPTDQERLLITEAEKSLIENASTSP
jgi:hypothetical protein